jgi:hypothetical protein
MLERCFNSNNPSYDNYGGRGITVCEDWFSFENFYADMGDPPPELSIDRFDNDGNYEPGNCGWVTRAQQLRNRRPRKRKRQRASLEELRAYTNTLAHVAKQLGATP